MNINVGIIDQQVRGLAQRLQPQIEKELDRTLDETTARSVAFTVLCAKVMLALTDDEAIQTLTEGGNDFGVDAIEVGDLSDGEFVVTLFQGKYHHQNLDGVRGFPQSGVEKAVQAVRALFNPAAPVDLNQRLQARIEEVRSLILDGNIPRVRFLLCSNGAVWSSESQGIIDRERFGDRAVFEHVNHDLLVQILGTPQPVKESIQFVGRSLAEDIQYVRVFIGKVTVAELARIMDAHGDRLLDRNIRRYLGLHGNRVNDAIRQTLTSEQERPNFFFYNNGVTLICDRFDFNALQSENHIVRTEGLQIIDGGQTSRTIQATLAAARRGQRSSPTFDNAHVLVRLYQVPKEEGPSIQTITYAVNRQNSVDLEDPRSDDERQRTLEMSMRDLGFEYRRQRSEGALGAKDVSVGTAAEAVLAVWREQPQRAKFRQGELFDRSYGMIFTKELTAAQVVIAVMLFRIAENKRKRPPSGAPALVRYASHFAAMLMGRFLLSDMGITLEKLDHREFEKARQLVEKQGDAYFDRAVQMLQKALGMLYGGQSPRPQLLAATFRRGDLLDYLHC